MPETVRSLLLENQSLSRHQGACAAAAHGGSNLTSALTVQVTPLHALAPHLLNTDPRVSVFPPKATTTPTLPPSLELSLSPSVLSFLFIEMGPDRPGRLNPQRGDLGGQGQ